MPLPPPPQFKKSRHFPPWFILFDLPTIRHKRVRGLASVNRQGVYKTGKKCEIFLFKVVRTVATSYCQLLKGKVKNLSGRNSDLALEYFNIMVIWVCPSCSISHACTA